MSKKNNKNTYNSEITKDDKNALGDASGNLRNDQGDDALLKQREGDVDFAAEDLDIPGRASTNKAKNKLKDEENKHFSLGNDDNDNLEPNTSQLKE
ncbi:hypothetical protein [Jejuia pallidilutea]|uniref:Uncharacterized protein n=1 Tax=Jejuia pallidilutea TaxID=504487 RepID=A0A090WNY2_9FLAO|nr:hypothetical protein [Jejuia pallidilutea]GAL69142.1 hypothetical protein JCM19301_1890 [Jejuia pallidilutea]GAL72119.1 hypothetical protein JCM19302_77 [Jejuia pallidilutea]GAL90719.1 hypothetical protein JCM19538_484 [Jejuia pallidilutea]